MDSDFKYSRQFGYSDTLILFGRSPFISTIADKVPLLIEKYHTIGCNYFCESYPEVEYVIFTDDIAPDVKNSTIVTWSGYFNNKEKHMAYEKYPNYPKRDLYLCSSSIEHYPICQTKGTLYNYVHTPSMALNWAWQNGFKNVVIAGIDLDYKELDSNGKAKLKHFDSVNDSDRFLPGAKKPGPFTKTYIKLARRHIMDVNEDFLNIFQLNPDNDMEIPKVSMDQLL